MRHALTAAAAAAALAWVLAAGPAGAAGIDEVRAGNTAFGAGRYEAAVEAFTRGIQAGDLEPEALAIAFNNRGVAYGELGDFDNAIRDYDQALRLRPGDPTSVKNLRIAHIRRGGAAAAMGDAGKALAEYGRAVELDPRHPLAYLRRGQLRLNRGDVAGAVGDLETARRLDPGNRDVAALLEQAERAERATAAATTPAAAPPALPPPPVAAVGPPPSPTPTDPPPTARVPAAQAARVADPAEADPAPAAGPEGAADGGQMRATADVNVRSGPGNSYAANGTLARGTIVTALDERLGWFRVRLPDGREGYVYRRWLAAEGQASP